MSLSQSSKPTYFNGLNALRFFAASLVVLHHIEEIRHSNGLFNLKDVDFFRNGGPAVSFFFVLSGFLIAYVLQNETQRTGNISIKNFYIKRSLRIWPLYFILILIGFVLLPLLLQGDKYASKFPYLNLKGTFMYLFFLPNLAGSFWRGHFLVPLWSIGVEEQFYLFFAPLAKWFRHQLKWILLGIILVKFITTSFLQYLIKDQIFFAFISTLRFEHMAMGGLFMLLLARPNNTFSKVISNKVFQVVLWSYTLFHLCYHLPVAPPYSITEGMGYFFYNLFNGAVFAAVIYNTCKAETSLFKFENKFLFKLGEISYGIYMYHMLFVFAGIEIMKKLGLSGTITSSGFIYVFVFGATIIAAHFSYKLLEKPIIQLKHKLK